MTPRTATLIGLTAILMWSLLTVLTVATGRIPAFQLAAMTFAIGAAVAFVSFIWRPAAFGALKQPLVAWLVGVGGGPKPDLGQETTRNHEANEVVPLVQDQADGEAAELGTRQRRDERGDLKSGDGLAQPSLDRVALSSHIHDDVVSSVRVYPNPRQTPPA